jgi:hypothetical protein
MSIGITTGESKRKAVDMIEKIGVATLLSKSFRSCIA